MWLTYVVDEDYYVSQAGKVVSMHPHPWATVTVDEQKRSMRRNGGWWYVYICQGLPGKRVTITLEPDLAGPRELGNITRQPRSWQSVGMGHFDTAWGIFEGHVGMMRGT